MSFRVTGLDPAPFRHLFGLSEAALSAHGVKRYFVDAKPGFPDRVEVRDMEVGETALLLNYTHQPADTPYRASHAIFVREEADRAAEFVGEVPEVMRLRMISLKRGRTSWRAAAPKHLAFGHTPSGQDMVGTAVGETGSEDPALSTVPIQARLG